MTNKPPEGIYSARVALYQRNYLGVWEPTPPVIEAVFCEPGKRSVYMGCLPEALAIHDPVMFSAWKESLRVGAERALWKTHPGMPVQIDDDSLRLPSL